MPNKCVPMHLTERGTNTAKNMVARAEVEDTRDV